MRCVLVALVVLFLTSAFAQPGQTVINAVTADGFDIILLDTPSWATHIQRSYGQQEFFVFGETTLRTITANTSNAFCAQPVNYTMSLGFIDLHTFFAPGQTVPYTIGVATFDPDDFKYDTMYGPYLPLAIYNPNSGAMRVQAGGPNWAGKQFYALRVDARDFTNVQTYFAGFFTNTSANTVDFGVLRTHTNLTATGIQSNFVYDSSIDYGSFYSGKYAAFSTLYRPWVHYIPNFGLNLDTIVAVADPNTRTVYSGIASSTSPFAPNPDQFLNFDGLTMVSTAISNITNSLYVGLANSGQAAGSIAVVDLTIPFDPPYLIRLPANCSNPKALVYDPPNTLYVALNGGSEVLKIDIPSRAVTGYQRLPEYLHRSWDGFVGQTHVYFVTSEQNSKVFRVNKNDFCSNRCPYFGYCSAGSCTCISGFSLSADGTTCNLNYVPPAGTVELSKGSEVALGVFFGLALLAAIIGWFMYFRSRRAAYQPV